MKVIEIGTGKTLDVNDEYGARLFEQGKAVPAPEGKPKEAPAEKTETLKKKK